MTRDVANQRRPLLRVVAVSLALVVALAAPATAQEQPEPRRAERAGTTHYRMAQLDAHDDQDSTSGWRSYRRTARLAGRDIIELPTFEQMIDADRTPNTMIVRLAAGAGPEVLDELGFRSHRELAIVNNLFQVLLPRNDGRDFAALLEAANAHPSVLYAEPEYRGVAAAVPDDPGDGDGLAQSWWLDEINAFDAWDVATSALAIGPVMVFDTRPEITHPDLVDNLWTNPFEVANNGADDDGNGHIDDVHGVNLTGVGRTHGTGSAGTVCAAGDNGIGYAGSAWECELLLYATAGTFSEYADALAYAIANGSRLSNHSWGTFSLSQSLADAVNVAESHDHLLVVAAHNFDRDIDAEPIYPAALTNANILTVGASGPAGIRRDYSNWGATAVDIAAPADFATTTPSGYGTFGGTSQAAPLVTGAVALLWAQVPSWSAADIKAHVLATSRPSPVWQGLSSSGGVIDMGAMLAGVATIAEPTPVSTSTPDPGLLTSGGDDGDPPNPGPDSLAGAGDGDPGDGVGVGVGDRGGAAANGGVLRAVSCLANNGRVDTTVVNTTEQSAVFRIEFGQLSPRERVLAPGDWWRMPVTGRPDGDHPLKVLRDGVSLVDSSIRVDCDGPTPRVTQPSVHVINTCRDGNGYIVFQLTNPTADVRSWIIEFDGVTNRSTSAPAAGAAVRAVTGRPDGDYEVRLRNGAHVPPLLELHPAIGDPGQMCHLAIESRQIVDGEIGK